MFTTVPLLIERIMAALVDGAERRFAAPFGVLTVACVPGPIAVGTGAAEGEADGAAAGAAAIRSARIHPLRSPPVTGHQSRPSALWPRPLIVIAVPLLSVPTTAAALEGCARTTALPVSELTVACAPGTKPEGPTVAGAGVGEAAGAALGAAVGLGTADGVGLALGAADGAAGAA